jgi:hypothetical protein
LALAASSLKLRIQKSYTRGTLAALKEEGGDIDPNRENYDHGRFAWIIDPEGNRIELWEPAKGAQNRPISSPCLHARLGNVAPRVSKGNLRVCFWTGKAH